MKKLATGLTLSAALGLSLFAAAPASAALPYYETCQAANDAGYGNFVEGDANFEGRVDKDKNGVVCQKDGLPRTDGSAPAPAPSKSQDPRDQALPDAAYTYPDCADAYAAGVYNIPASSKDYHKDIDSDLDGVACEFNVKFGVPMEGREKEGAKEIAAIKAAAVKEKIAEKKAEPKAEMKSEEKQVAEVPAGAVDAGIAPESDPAAALGVGALGLAVVAGGAVMARRRAQA